MTTGSRNRVAGLIQGAKRTAAAATAAAAVTFAAGTGPAAANQASGVDPGVSVMLTGDREVDVVPSKRVVDRRVLPDDAPLPGGRTTMPKVQVITTNMQASGRFLDTIRGLLKAKHGRSVHPVGSNVVGGEPGIVNLPIRELHTQIPLYVGDNRPDTVVLAITPEAITDPEFDAEAIKEAMEQIIRIRPNTTVLLVLPAPGNRMSETQVSEFLAALNRTRIPEDRRLRVVHASSDLKSLMLEDQAVGLGRQVADQVHLLVEDAALLSVSDDSLQQNRPTDIPGFQPAAGTKSLTVSM